MKKLAFALYVAVVLLISGLARANAMTLDSVAATPVQYQSPVAIYSVSNDGAKVYVGGTLRNPCSGQPAAMLTVSETDSTTLILHLTSASPVADACVARTVPFTTRVDLPLLARVSRLSLNPSLIYIVKVEGFDFTLRLPGADLLK